MSSRGNTAQTVRLNPFLESELSRLSNETKKSKAEIIRESVEQHLVGETWLEKCDAVLNSSINRVEESNRALEARIKKLVDEGAIDFEIRTISKEIAESEERLKTEMHNYFESKFKTAFENMLRKLPEAIIQIHEQQKGQHQQGRRES